MFFVWLNFSRDIVIIALAYNLYNLRTFSGRLWRGERLHCWLSEEEARVSIFAIKVKPLHFAWKATKPEMVTFPSVSRMRAMMSGMVVWQRVWRLWTNEDGGELRQDWKWKGWIFWHISLSKHKYISLPKHKHISRVSWKTNVAKEYFDSHQSPLERPQNAKGFEAKAFDQTLETATKVFNPWAHFGKV